MRSYTFAKAITELSKLATIKEGGGGVGSFVGVFFGFFFV